MLRVYGCSCRNGILKIRGIGKNGRFRDGNNGIFPKMPCEPRELRDSSDSHFEIVSQEFKKPKRMNAFTCG